MRLAWWSVPLLVGAAADCASKATEPLQPLQPPTATEAPGEGFDDPLGSGATFAMGRFVPAGPSDGFNFDQRCDPSRACIPNPLSLPLSIFGSPFTYPGASHALWNVIEIDGLDACVTHDDPSVTVKLYAAMSPCNSLQCDLFAASPTLEHGQSSVRLLGAIADHHVTTATDSASILLLPTSTAAFVPLRDVRTSASVSTDRGLHLEGLLGGVLEIHTMARLPAMRQSPGPSRLLDKAVVDLSLQPDVDLDGDGIECLFDIDGDGAIDHCCDGAGALPCADASGHCNGTTIPPLDPKNPWTCALDPRMADGYGITFAFYGEPIRIAGIAP